MHCLYVATNGVTLHKFYFFQGIGVHEMYKATYFTDRSYNYNFFSLIKPFEK